MKAVKDFKILHCPHIPFPSGHSASPKVSARSPFISGYSLLSPYLVPCLSPTHFFLPSYSGLSLPISSRMFPRLRQVLRKQHSKNVR